jgi:hypothetical protein
LLLLVLYVRVVATTSTRTDVSRSSPSPSTPINVGDKIEDNEKATSDEDEAKETEANDCSGGKKCT